MQLWPATKANLLWVIIWSPQLPDHAMDRPSYPDGSEDCPDPDPESRNQNITLEVNETAEPEEDGGFRYSRSRRRVRYYLNPPVLDENENVTTSGDSKGPTIGKLPISSIFDETGLNKYINPTIANLRTQGRPGIYSFADYIFFRKKRQALVQFPDDVIQDAELRGETAGKDREVRRSSVSGRRRRKVRKTIQHWDIAAGERDAMEDDLLPPSGCLCCFRFCEFCVFATAVNNEDDRGPPETMEKVGGFTKTYRRDSDQFASYLDFATCYIDGNQETISYAENIFRFPEPGRRPEALNVNFLAAKVWLFAFGVHHLFQTKDSSQDIPTKAEFEELLTCFADLTLATDRITKRALLYQSSHTTFGAATFQILNRTARRLCIKPTDSKFLTKDPLTFGKGLKLLSRDARCELDSQTIRIRIRVPKKHKRWENLNRTPMGYRIGVLKSLLDSIQVEILSINSQMRFLVEDVFNGRFEEADPHFLSCLHAMDGLVRKFLRSQETTESHLQNLSEVIQAVISEAKNFIARGTHLIEKIVELSDMIQLAVAYLRDEYAVNIQNGFIPSTEDLFHFKQEWVKKRSWRRWLCCQRKPGFSASEFFHTTFRKLLATQSILTTDPDGELILAVVPEGTEEEVSVRFAGNEEPDSHLSLHSTRDTSAAALDPIPGAGGVWDELETKDPKDLNKQVLETSQSSVIAT